MNERFLMKHWVKIILELTKFRIALFAAFSTSAGFILAKQGLSGEMMTAVSGVFFLACGCSALNQYQERQRDRLMERTRERPIPSQRLDPATALKIAFFLLFLGAFTLLKGSNGIAFGLGVLALFWYNGLYTFLKRKTAFAVIPGALVGVIPPLLGWVHGGGRFFDPQILAVAFFFFIWQIPHFWLLLLNFGRDYEKAGFPSLTRIFTAAQLKRITFTWVFATAVACLMIPLFGLVNFYAVQVSLLIAGIWLVWKAFMLLRSHHSEFSLRLTFNSINAYVLLVMFLLTLDHLL
jgi:protoheme IX farnesyltransferase